MLIGVGLAVIYVQSRSVASKIEALRAAGEPTTLLDLAPEPVPAEENAEAYLSNARADVEAILLALLPVTRSDEHARQTYNELQLQAIDNVLAAHENAFDEMAKAAECEHWRPGLNYRIPASQVLQWTQHDMRGFVGVLHLRCSTQLARGESDAAFATCIVALKLARLANELPAIHPYLAASAAFTRAIGMANQVLQNAEIGPEQRDQLEKELATLKFAETCRWAIRSERVVSLAMADEALGRSIVTRMVYSRFVNRYLDEISKALEAVDDEAVFEAHDVHSGDALVDNAVSVVEQARMVMYRQIAQTRSLRVLNAIQRSGVDDVESLDLAKLGLPAEVTIDPYTGEPLKVKRSDEGWTVYAVGPDLKDDGGEIHGGDRQPLDFGVGPPAGVATDR